MRNRCNLNKICLILAMVFLVSILNSGCCCCCKKELVNTFMSSFYQGMAESYYEDGKHDDALSTVNKSLEYDPNNGEAISLKEKILKSKEDKNKREE